MRGEERERAVSRATVHGIRTLDRSPRKPDRGVRSAIGNRVEQ